MPISCNLLSGLDPSFRRDLRVAEHHNEFIGRHALQIFAALERIARADDPPNSTDALIGLSHVGMWAGEDEQLRVLPLLIATSNDPDTEKQKLAIKNLTTALRHFKGYKSYNKLPIASLRPLIVASLKNAELRGEAVNIAGMMGTRAGSEVVDALLRVKKEQTNETPGFHASLDWAIRRARGEQ